MAVEEKPKVRGLTKQAVSGTAWSTLATVGKQVLTFASLATVARMLGPNAYGVMGMAALVIAFINNFRDLGTAIAIIQKPTVSQRLLSSLFWVNAALGVSLCVLVVATSPIVAGFFHTPELSAVLRVLSLSFLIASCGVVHSALLNREMAFRAIAAVDLGSAVLTFLVALVCAYNGQGVWSLVFANVTNSVASTIGYWLAHRFRPAFEFDTPEVASIAKFSSNLSGFGLVNYACRNADNLVVGKVLGSAPLGFYQMAYNMMLTPLQNISSVITQVLFPAFSRIQDDDGRFRHAYVRGCMLIALITFPVMAGLGVVADPLVRALLGQKWLGTILIFQILAPVGLVQSVATTTGIIYQSKGRADWMFRWSLLVLVTTVAAFLTGVRHGAVGVAAAYAIVYLGLLLYPGFAIPFRLIGMRFRDFALALLPQLAWTGVMAAACFAWLRLLAHLEIANPWTLLTSTMALGTVVYVAGMLVLRPQVILYLEEVLETSENRMIARGLSLLRWRKR
jgi:O-antigen/teichoic acid export membrane protein